MGFRTLLVIAAILGWSVAGFGVNRTLLSSSQTDIYRLLHKIKTRNEVATFYLRSDLQFTGHILAYQNGIVAVEHTAPGNKKRIAYFRHSDLLALAADPPQLAKGETEEKPKAK